MVTVREALYVPPPDIGRTRDYVINGTRHFPYYIYNMYNIYYIYYISRNALKCIEGSGDGGSNSNNDMSVLFVQPEDDLFG
jgi:hypothetical protein